jgi:hypothetical protein
VGYQYVTVRYISQMEILPGAIQKSTSNHFVVPDVPGSRLVTLFDTYLNVLKTSILLAQCVSHGFFIYYVLCDILHILQSV